MVRRSLTFVASALIGTAVGTVAGLLLAPEPGSSTRQSLRLKAGEFLGQWPVSLGDVRQRLGLSYRPRPIDASFIQLYREGGG